MCCYCEGCSSVGYELPLGGGRGWLSASGALSTKSTSDLKINFDTFWVDRGGAPLRSSLSQEEGKAHPTVSNLAGLAGGFHVSDLVAASCQSPVTALT